MTALGMKLSNSPLQDDGDNVSAGGRMDANTLALTEWTSRNPLWGFREMRCSTRLK
jgi:hypothetical protein